MGLIKVNCVFCGKEFFRARGRFNEAKKSNWKQYCSQKCLSKDKTKKQILFCENCGEVFERTLCAVSLHNYCSKSCAAKVNNKKKPKRKRGLKKCRRCGKAFARSKGNLKYCSVKCRREARRRYTSNQLIEIIKVTAQELKRTPAKRELRAIADRCVGLFGSWNNAIITAGLQPNRSHSQRMYKCVNTKASDGHMCNSVSELIIDNWFTENKIIHKKNIAYPKTNHKADWGIDLGGQTIFVEYFGLAKDSPRYDRSVTEKREICRKYKIELIEIYPEDLYPKGRVDKDKLKRKLKYLKTIYEFLSG